RLVRVRRAAHRAQQRDVVDRRQLGPADAELVAEPRRDHGVAQGLLQRLVVADVAGERDRGEHLGEAHGRRRGGGRDGGHRAKIAGPSGAQGYSIGGYLGAVPPTPEPLPWERRLGAVPVDDEHVQLRVWALRADEVRVRVGGDEHALDPIGGGVY